MDEMNKDLIQSFKMTTIRNDFGIYAQRTLVRLVEATQFALSGRQISGIKYTIEEDLLGYKRVSFPISAILADGDKSNYSQAKKELKALQTRTVEYEDDRYWVSICLISSVRFDNRLGLATLGLEPEIWNCLLDFSKGFRRFELNKALSLKSVYSLRLYELLSGQERPITFTIEYLKNMFGLVGKYDNATNFINRVIKPAKEELDKIAPYSFDFNVVFEEGKRGRKPIKAITFKPYYIPKNRDEDLKKKEDFNKLSSSYPGVMELNQGTKNYLIHTLGFTAPGVENNKQMLLFAQNRIPDFDMFLRSLAVRARCSINPQGYVINAIKKQLQALHLKF